VSDCGVAVARAARPADLDVWILESACLETANHDLRMTVVMYADAQARRAPSGTVGGTPPGTIEVSGPCGAGFVARDGRCMETMAAR